MAYEAFAEKGWEVHYLSLEKFPLNHEKIHFYRIPLTVKKDENLLFWIAFFVLATWYMFYISLKISPGQILIFGPDYALISFPAKIFRKNKLILFARGDQLQSLRETEQGIKKSISLLLYKGFCSLGYKISDI
jgi:hypothetical protein